MERCGSQQKTDASARSSIAVGREERTAERVIREVHMEQLPCLDVAPHSRPHRRSRGGATEFVAMHHPLISADLLAIKQSLWAAVMGKATEG